MNALDGRAIEKGVAVGIIAAAVNSGVTES
jgi:hypothetical protein